MPLPASLPPIPAPPTAPPATPRAGRTHPRWLRQLGLILVFAVILGAIGVLMGEVVARLRGLEPAQAESLEWSLSQVEVEFLLVEEAAIRAEAVPAPPLDALTRHFDLFYARLEVILLSPRFAPLRADPEGAAALARIEGFATRALPLIEAPPDRLRAALPLLSAQITALRPDLRTLSARGLAVFARSTDARRDALGKTLARLALLTFVLILALAALVVALALLNRLNRQRIAEIARTRARLQTILETALDAVVLADDTGRITGLNHAAEEMFGLSVDQARGRMLRDLVLPDPAEAEADPALGAFVETGAPRALAGHRQLDGHRADGHTFPAELSLARARGAGGAGDAPLWIATIRDISDRAAAEQALRAARDQAEAGERAKAEFLAVMSHEMRTPLNGLIGTIDLLAKEDLPPRPRDYVAILHATGRHLLRHVNDVLDLTRAESGRPADPVPYDLAELTEEVAASQRGLAEAAGNRLVLDLPAPPLPPLMGDPAQLRQVLFNLLGNAVKFTEKGTITLRARRLGTELEIRVSDTGIGIAPEDLTRIFADFVTLDPSYRRRAEGTGLGLGIARRMAEAMGGRLGVDSTLGAGSSFWLRLPLVPAPTGRAGPAPERPGPEGSVPENPAAPPLSVLLVEDNAINRFVAREMLEAAGHEVIEASDGAEGVRAAAARAFDVILMDVSMPGMDGLAATRAIRAGAGASARAPIVALTAHAQPEEHARFRTAGMSGSLTKPITRAALAGALAALSDGGAEGPRAEAGPAETVHTETAPTKTAAELIDIGHLAEMTEALSAAEFADFHARFLAEGGALLDRSEAPEGLAGAALAGALHRLSGSASVFGARALMAALGTAEARAEAGAAPDWPALAALWHDSRTALESLLRDDAPDGGGLD